MVVFHTVIRLKRSHYYSIIEICAMLQPEQILHGRYLSFSFVSFKSCSLVCGTYLY